MMPSASPKQRVLIVGAKFGEMYLNAFMQPPEGLELVGLLAQGSARSRELAHAFGIPLYTSPEQITRMPDIACIVVRSTVAGGTGTQLARHFLTRGVHVIQEHPLHPDDMQDPVPVGICLTDCKDLTDTYYFRGDGIVMGIYANAEHVQTAVELAEYLLNK